MILNRYEETPISNQDLPISWQSQQSQLALESFLQTNWEQRSVFYDDGVVDSKQQFLGFQGIGDIRTRNYIGTIVFNGEQINIFPKVFRKNKGYSETEDLSQKHLMSNLVKWIEYCNRMSYPFINISTELSDSEDLVELFIALYVGYVKEAMKRRSYHQYVEETEDARCIKGKFDVKDYFTVKIPNGQYDKFKCTYSTFEFDNLVNQIIKYTCKHIYSITESSKSRKSIRDILIRLNDVSDVPCKPRDCDRVRLGKMHSRYRMILSMSKMFLLNKTSSYTMDKSESFCFLFPTELLFEGFVGGYMQEVVEEYGGKVKLQPSDIYLIDDIEFGGQSLGRAFTMRHDIRVSLDDEQYILDTKYKQVSRFEGNVDGVRKIVTEETKQSDIYQVCEYARKSNVSDVFLLYPMYRFEENEPDFPIGRSLSETKDINIHFIRVPFIFEDDEERVKGQLREIIEKIFSLKD